MLWAILFIFLFSIISIFFAFLYKTDNEKIRSRSEILLSRKNSKNEILDSINEESIRLRKNKSTIGLFKNFQKDLIESHIGWSLWLYILIIFLIFLLVQFILLIFSFSNLIFTSGVAVVTALIIPYYLVKRRLKKYRLNFETELPNAIDIVVRGIRSGIPLIDCFRLISEEAQEPVRSEFSRIMADQSLGMPLPEALQALPNRVTSVDANFLSIVISIQSQTGGNLSEALSNLAKIIRERQKMRRKIRAMSSEATASAAIIGSLPFLVAGAVYLLSPDYILILFREVSGIIVLLVSAAWMIIGIFIMKKMIEFEI